MARSKLLCSLIVVVAFCAMAGTSFAKAPKCGFNGDYSFFFSDPSGYLSGVGYFSVAVSSASKCRSGVVIPGGIINCAVDAPPYEFEDFIESGSVFLETDGEGTMLIQTNSSSGICDTGRQALELDISVVQKGKRVLFNSDGEDYAGSGLIPQAGYNYTFTGRADKCFAGQISGCYDARFWAGTGAVADCTICVNGAGGITGGSCRCNYDDTEYLSEIETGGYTLGENCQSSTGYMWFTTSSDPICGDESSLALDFAVAQGGEELIGGCDPGEYIVGTSLANTGYDYLFTCAFEGYLQ